VSPLREIIAPVGACEVIAIIVVERDERGNYFATTTSQGAPVEIGGGWYTLLACLDAVGRALLDLLSFPRARATTGEP
jgi:hypothetical protein